MNWRTIAYIVSVILVGPCLVVALCYGAQLKDTIISNDLTIDTNGTIIMEGSTDDANDLTITLVNPSAPRTQTHPNASGTFALTSQADGTTVLGTDTDGNYTESIADAGNSTVTVVNGVAEGGIVTLDVIDVNCTNCLGTAQIADVYLLNTGDISSGNQSVQHATNPAIFATDTTNTVTTLIQSFDTLGAVGTSSNHLLALVSAGAAAASFDTSQNTILNKNVTIGDASAGIDFTLTFNGETNDGVLTYDEDNAIFSFDDLIATATGFDGVGAISLPYGSADITDHTFTTDSTGNAEMVFPDDSVGPAELDSTTGAYDFGGVTSLAIPNGASPTVDANGEVATDSTNDDFTYFSTAKRTLTYIFERCFTKEALNLNDDNIPFWTPRRNITLIDAICHCDDDSGDCTTPADLSFEHYETGTASTVNSVTGTIDCEANATGDTRTTLSGDNTVDADDVLRFDTDSTPVPSTDYYNICFSYTVDAQ